MRKFEKVSKRQFKEDSEYSYDNIVLPTRATEHSAGYDFYSVFDFDLKPGEYIKIPTGIRIKLNSDEFLALYVRSSMGFKYNIRMCNQVGIIDSDYYDSDNEGHIWIKLKNEGEKVYSVKVGDKICQGIFQKFYLTDDDNTKEKRNGGLGSTN